MVAGSSSARGFQDGCRPARRFDDERFGHRANAGQAGSLPRVCARTHTAHSSLEDDPVHAPSHTRPCPWYDHLSSCGFASAESLRQTPHGADFSCFERSHAHTRFWCEPHRTSSRRDEQTVDLILSALPVRHSGLVKGKPTALRRISSSRGRQGPLINRSMPEINKWVGGTWGSPRTPPVRTRRAFPYRR